MSVSGKVHIIEELRLFPAGEPVLKLLLDPHQARAGHDGKLALLLWGGKGERQASGAAPTLPLSLALLPGAVLAQVGLSAKG